MTKKKDAAVKAAQNSSISPSLDTLFKNPTSEYRGAPFWAWNGKLDPETCRRQIRQMHDGGLGGFFMHSRTGLDTPYLSKEWFDCINACTDEAKKLKMRAWLYDEDRWPSGAAGGLVTKDDPKYRTRRLFIYVCPNGIIPEDFPEDCGKPVTAAFLKKSGAIALFGAKILSTDSLAGAMGGVSPSTAVSEKKKNGGIWSASSVRRLSLAKDPAVLDGESIIFARIEIADTSSWFNGGAYLDTLNPDATKQFIKVTHDAYAKDLGKDLGGIVPGIFTDEPNHANVVFLEREGKDGSAQIGLVWTDKLPAAFRKLYGYDIMPRLLELVFDIEGVDSHSVRHNFNNCVTELFTKGFMKQIGDWCEKHKCEFTGHVLEEDTLTSQTNKVGSCMRCYEWMQAPGIDMLTENDRPFSIPKQLSSVAHQFGRKWRLSELYGCTGWDFSFAGQKATGDWQLALGVNLRCQHLAWYTMLGQAKRDYPACIFYQSPWWEQYNKVEDYFGRVHTIMTQGEEVRDILLLHPVESVWSQTRIGWLHTEKVTSIQKSFASITNQLLASHLDFDYGDEDIMARHGKIRKDGSLIVGKAAYKAVVVPSMITMRASTLSLLKRFVKAGGKVYFAGSVPDYVDAVPSKAAAVFAKGNCVNSQELYQALSKKFRRVSIADSSTNEEFIPALYLLREDDKASYLFICNIGEEYYSPTDSDKQDYIRFLTRTKGRTVGCDDVTITFNGQAKEVLELNPETGDIIPALAAATKNGCQIRTSLPPIGSRLFVIKKAAKAGSLAKAPLPPFAERKVVYDAPLATSFNARLSEGNVLVLDHPSYKIGDGEWQPELEILRIDRNVRDTLGVQRRKGQMFQPWTIEKKVNPKRVEVSLRYTFDVEDIPSGDLAIALEAPNHFKLAVNGIPLSTSLDIGWWVDTSLRKIRIDPSLLHLGENTIDAVVDFTENFSGLEIIYLLGNFGSKIEGVDRVVVTDPPASLVAGNLCTQGLSFYSGNVGYATAITPEFNKGERVIVSCGSYNGAGVRVLVDGRPAGVVAWEPNEVDITDFVESGRQSEIVIELLGNRRNSHGSLHLNERWPRWHGPDSFEFGPENMGYNLVPLGFEKAPRLIVIK